MKKEEEKKRLKPKKKVCEQCGSSFTYSRKDGSYFCRKCGWDSQEE